MWAFAAIPAMFFLLASDAGNNLSVVHFFSSGDVSLWAWRGLALGCAIATAPLGFAASRNPYFCLPCLIVALIGGILTVLSTQTDFSSRTEHANKYKMETSGLISERSALLSSLNGDPPCKSLRWCDSKSKELRVLEINKELSSKKVQVDPTLTYGGENLTIMMAYLRAFGVPIVVASLGNVLGLIFHSKNNTQLYEKKGSFKETFQEKNLVPTSNRLSNRLSKEESFLLAEEWLKYEPQGRISKIKLKQACRAEQKHMQYIVKKMIESGMLERMSNGQLSKK